jgi:hypothetical protein
MHEDRNLEEWVELEERLCTEDRPHLKSLTLRDVLFTQPEVAEHSTRADEFTVAYHRAFREFVRRPFALTAGDDGAVSNHSRVIDADAAR